MILFISGQYAGAQYIHPIINKWSDKKKTKWKLLATGTSCKYWDEVGVNYKKIHKPNVSHVAECLDLLNPNLIITSTSVNNDFETLFILEAKKKSIPTVCFIDFWSNYLMRFKYKREIIFPDNIFAIDNRCKEEMILEGIPEKKIKVIGQPYLEKVLKNLPKMGDNLLLASQPIKKYYGKRLGYDEMDFWKICFEAIKNTGIRNVISTHHPEEVPYRDINNLNAIFLKGKGIKNIEDSHTVLSMFSMQMMVGYLWGRNVASIQPKFGTHDPSPLSRWGLVPRLKTVNEVVEFIENNKLQTINQDFKQDSNVKLDQFKLTGSLKRLELFCFKYIK
jgi:hypothetical protein